MVREKLVWYALLLALRTCLPVGGEALLPLSPATAAELAAEETMGVRPAPVEAMTLPAPTPSPTVTAEPAASPEELTVSTPVPTEVPTATETPAPVSPETPSPTASGARIISYTDGGDGVRLRNYTELSEDWNALSREELTLSLPGEGTEILIVHTHGTEAYTPDEEHRYDPTDTYHTTDEQCSVIHVGDELQKALEARGFRVKHLRELCDYPSYTGSYNRSEELTGAALEEEPGIAVVIDLHRDAIGDEEEIYRTVTELDGDDCAQLMLVVGTGENGLSHPRWRENLKLAMALVTKADELYPCLFRPIHLVPERYNQQLSDGALLLEVGTTGNTLTECERSVAYLAEVMEKTLGEFGIRNSEFEIAPCCARSSENAGAGVEKNSELQ